MARRPPAGEAEPDVEEADHRSTFTAGLVALVAVSLAVLPTVAAVGLLALPAGRFVVVLGCLGAALTGVRLNATACAIGARLAVTHPAGGAVACSD